jgi:hypothetical protein
VLNPAIFGEVLVKLLLGNGHLSAFVIKHDGAGTGGTLVYGKQISGHQNLLLFSGDSNRTEIERCDAARK